MLLIVFSLVACTSAPKKPNPNATPVTLVEGNIYRGPRPMSVEALKLALPDVKTIIYLEDGFYEDIHDDVYKRERKHIADYGVTMIEHPLSDVTPPSPTDLESIVADIVRTSKGGVVYVHCLHGNDRTGMSLAAYRILIDQWPKDKAVKEMFDLGFHRFPYEFWTMTLDYLR